MLDTHPDKKNIVITILPLCKEILNSTGDWPIGHKEFKEFIQQTEKEFGFKFDLSEFDKLENPDLWHISILTNEYKKK